MANAATKAAARPVNSSRIIRLPDEVSVTDSSTRLDARAKMELTVKENVALEKLARALIEQKIRPEILREDVIADLAKWAREMLIGPALPFNKHADFEDGVLESTDFVADAEIFLETLPGCHRGLIERNRADEKKKHVYPDPGSKMRVREEVLRNRCVTMVQHFASKKGITDEVLKKKAADEFYAFYRVTIMERRPSSYNSYSGVMACMGDMKFLKQSEDIVLFGLGLTTEPPEELTFLKRAPPPLHTMAVFSLAMSLSFWALPSLSSIDEHATVDTFTTSIFNEGPFSFSPMALGVIRLFFAIICVVTTIAKIRNGSEIKIVKLHGSKLRGGYVQMKGWRTQGFYTSWAWNLLGISFFLGGTIAMLVGCERKDILDEYPWILRSALISFEIAAPSALLTSFIVTYALWPQAYKDGGASGTRNFKGWVGLLQHNANSAMVLLEVTLLGGLPVMLSHAAFAPLFAGLYQMFLWIVANYWAPSHGPVYPYFFMDTTLGARTTYFMLALLAVIGFFFVLFALLNMGVTMLEQSDCGSLPLVCCHMFMSYMLMKFND